MPTSPSTPNTLYYGDNFDILRRYVEDESVDLIYLDPPFNSTADYKVLRGTGISPVSDVPTSDGPQPSKTRRVQRHQREVRN